MIDSGILIVINKPTGITSRDVVNQLTKIFKTKRIGHTGTLDPLASGVLVITIGKYTKLNELLMSTYKEYSVEMILGYETDTLDITGKKVKSKDIIVDKETIKEAINSFKGKYLQEVPKYSAVKVKGKKLYEYARNNIDVELPKKEVEIKEISNILIDKNTISFDCTVSKGTYIRSLVRDIGEKLGTYATMTALVRTKQGKFDIKDAYTIEEIEQGLYRPINIKSALDSLVVVNASASVYKEVSNGVVKECDVKEDLILFKYASKEVALYKRISENKFGMYVKF